MSYRIWSKGLRGWMRRVHGYWVRWRREVWKRYVKLQAMHVKVIKFGIDTTRSISLSLEVFSARESYLIAASSYFIPP
jgi:hypothetical protein